MKLIVLINDVSLRALAAREMKTGFGWVQAKPSSSFAPVAITPDELGAAWRDARLQLPGSGTVSNPNFRQIGSACIAERRAIELLDHGSPKTNFMKFGDRVRIEVNDDSGRSIFGAIHQRMVEAPPP